MAELKSLSHTHQAIMDYLMANPTVALGDVAKEFGYTQPWLSQIIHSDAFQVMLKEKQGMAFHHTVMTLKEKIHVVAHQTMDKMAELVKDTQDLRTVKDVAEGMLDRLGYGAKPVAAPGGMNLTINQQNNVHMTNSNAAEIAAARAILQARTSALGVQVDGVSVPLALPRTSASPVGEVVLEPRDSSASGENQTGEGWNPLREESSREVLK
jgi:hypothetical protein